jgi:hypothetical protein
MEFDDVYNNNKSNYASLRTFCFQTLQNLKVQAKYPKGQLIRVTEAL